MFAATGAAWILFGLALARSTLLGALVTTALGGLALMFGVGQIRMSRAIQRLSSLSAGPRPPRTRSVEWSPPPPLVIRELIVADAPATPVPKGVAILFLWVFDRTVTTSLLFRLNKIGPVYFLRGGGVLAFDVTQVPRMAFGRIDRMIEETEDEVMQRLRSFRVKQRFGYFSLLTMACTYDVWVFALDRMLERCRVVVVDLSRFSVGRIGIEYEIGVLFDRVHLDQVVFVCGPETDREGLRHLLQSTWDTLAPTSPNRIGDRALCTLALTTALVDSNASRGDYTSTTRVEQEFIAALVAEASAKAPLKPLPPPRPSA